MREYAQQFRLQDDVDQQRVSQHKAIKALDNSEVQEVLESGEALESEEAPWSQWLTVDDKARRTQEPYGGEQDLATA